ncbi:hydrolase [Nakamurella silvestris]|nr:hydrolase [Nakamurella silvestris]
MTIWTCFTCGIEHPDTPRPPANCAICDDERQWVPPSGQQWTTQAELIEAGYTTHVRELEPDLYAITVEPELAIGHRGLLVRTPAGNLLWEPPGYINEQVVDEVRGLGGVAVISASHPHLTGASIQWSHAFGGVPVLVSAADQQWIRRPDPAVELWSGVREVLPGLSFHQCGGHFAGSSVAHWPAGAQGRGALLTGDTILPGPDGKSVSVMRSYPNRIPLPERAVRRIQDTVRPLTYDRLYSAFVVVDTGAHQIVERSLDRYVSWISGDLPD